MIHSLFNQRIITFKKNPSSNYELGEGMLVMLLDLLNQSKTFNYFCMNTENNGGKIEIFCRYIIKNGKKIFPKKGQFFHFWVDAKKA